MKGQVFTLDLAFAVFVYVLILFFFISSLFITSNSTISNYEKFKIQKKIFDASEVMITISNISLGGLAVYEENTVKHHELDLGKIKEFGRNFDSLKKRLLLEDYDVWIRITKRSDGVLLNLGEEIKGIKITRFALCGDDECVLEIIAR